MRLFTLVPALALAACTATSDAADATDHGGSGSSQRSFEVGTFQSVALGGSDNVVITVGGAPSVRAEGPADSLDRLDIKVKNGTLAIGRKHELNWSGSYRPVTVYVTTPALEGAMIGGSGNMRIDSVSGPHFAGSIGGSGDMDVGTLRVDDASFSIAGSGNVKAAGAARNLKISIVGSGGLEAGALDARSANISITGSGNAVIQASDAAAISLVGSGDVTVHGKAKCSVSKLGSGDAHCMG